MKQILFALAVLLLVLNGARAEVTAERFSKRFACVTIRGDAANLDSALEPVQHVAGIVLDLRALDVPSDVSALDELLTILSRFTDDALDLDSVTLSPGGPWPYVDPLVIQADSTMRGFDLVRAFVTVRPYAEIERTPDAKRAAKRLKALEAQFRTQRQDRMDRLFER